MGTRSGLSTASSSSAGRPASSVDAGPDCADWYASRSSADVPALFCAPNAPPKAAPISASGSEAGGDDS